MVQSASRARGVATDALQLTRNEQLVLSALDSAKEPLKAYELLAALKDQGVKAPMTVYRALDRLKEKGLVHKLNAMNAFVMCNHATPHPMQMFLICPRCNKVEELEEQRVTRLDWPRLKAVAERQGFAAASAQIEIRGICKDCS